MAKVSTIGLDLAKNVFQVHAIDEQGKVVVRRSLRRAEVLLFSPSSPRVLSAWRRAARHITGRAS